MAETYTLRLLVDDSAVRRLEARLNRIMAMRDPSGGGAGGGAKNANWGPLQGIVDVFSMGSSGGEKSSKRGMAKNIAKLGGIAAAIGSIVFLIKKILEGLPQSSPMLRAVLKIMETAWMFTLRPIGDFIGYFLRPIVIYMLRNVAIPFYNEWRHVAKDLGSGLGDFVVNALHTIPKILDFILEVIEFMKNPLEGSIDLLEKLLKRIFGDFEWPDWSSIFGGPQEAEASMQGPVHHKDSAKVIYSYDNSEVAAQGAHFGGQAHSDSAEDRHNYNKMFWSIANQNAAMDEYEKQKLLNQVGGGRPLNLAQLVDQAKNLGMNRLDLEAQKKYIHEKEIVTKKETDVLKGLWDAIDGVWKPAEEAVSDFMSMFNWDVDHTWLPAAHATSDATSHMGYEAGHTWVPQADNVSSGITQGAQTIHAGVRTANSILSSLTAHYGNQLGQLAASLASQIASAASAARGGPPRSSNRGGGGGYNANQAHQNYETSKLKRSYSV